MICVAGSCRERIESEASPSERIGRLLISLVIDILHRGAEREREITLSIPGQVETGRKIIIVGVKQEIEILQILPKKSYFLNCWTLL